MNVRAAAGAVLMALVMEVMAAAAAAARRGLGWDSRRMRVYRVLLLLLLPLRIVIRARST